MNKLDPEGLDGIRMTPEAQPTYSATEIEGIAAVDLRVEASPVPTPTQPISFEEERPTDPQIPSPAVQVKASLPELKMKLPAAPSLETLKGNPLRRISILAVLVLLITGLATWAVRTASQSETPPEKTAQNATLDPTTTSPVPTVEDSLTPVSTQSPPTETTTKEDVGALIENALKDQESGEDAGVNATDKAQADADAKAKADVEAKAKADADARAKADAEAKARKAKAKADAEAKAKPQPAKTSATQYGVPTPLSAIPKNLPAGSSVAPKAANEAAYSFPGSFTPNNNAMRVTDRSQLDTIAAQLIAGSGPVRIVGHTDSSGKKEANLRLGWLRAHSVKKLLVHMGVDEQRIRVQSAGSSQPRTTNDTEQGRANNRRVVILLTQ